jgi:uncharacterized membrane protein
MSRRHPGVRTKDELSLGERAADRAVTFFGSWPFVIWQTVIVLAWMFLNTWHGWHYAWDGYPYILLNLAFSTQAAYAAPLVMIAQRRNAQIASERAEHDHRQLYRIALAMGVEGEL